MKRSPHQEKFNVEITELTPGNHLCCFYETDEEQRAVVIPFLRQGLEQGQKVLYLIDDRRSEKILKEIRQAGIEIDSYLNQEQLHILSDQDAYQRDGHFDPDRMIALLRTETDRAAADKYAALRVIGEMTWILGHLPKSDRVIEFEAKLGDFLSQNPCLAIFEYDQRRFEAQILLDALRTHPVTVIGTEIYDNVYYVPPQQVLQSNLAEMELKDKLKFLSEHKQAEQARSREFQALEALSVYQKSVITSEIFQVEALHKSAPALFDTLVADYEQLLELALKEQLYKIDHNLSERLQRMAEQLGFTRAGPRDVVNIHISALKRKMRTQTPLKAQAYTDVGRITVLQLMGYLVSYYRNYYSGVMPGSRSADPISKREETRE